MFITLNDRPLEIASNQLSSLIASLQLPEEGWAISINQRFVPKSKHMHTELKDGDIIDLVKAYPGG